MGDFVGKNWKQNFINEYIILGEQNTYENVFQVLYSECYTVFKNSTQAEQGKFYFKMIKHYEYYWKKNVCI